MLPHLSSADFCLLQSQFSAKQTELLGQLLQVALAYHQQILQCLSDNVNHDQFEDAHVIVKTVGLVDLIEMRMTGCLGESRLVLHIPSSS